MCDCADKMNEALKPHNTRLSSLTQITSTMDLRARIQVATEKIDSKVRKPARAVAATFCPFCGNAQGDKR